VTESDDEHAPGVGHKFPYGTPCYGVSGEWTR